MNALEMRQKLADMVFDAGSAVKFSEKHDLSHSHVSAIIRGDAKPGNTLLKVMGLKRMVGDKKNKPRYEDF